MLWIDFVAGLRRWRDDGLADVVVVIMGVEE